MRVKVIAREGRHSEICDADTGEVVKGVRTVRFEHKAGEAAVLVLELIEQFDFEGELPARIVNVCASCNKEMQSETQSGRKR